MQFELQDGYDEACRMLGDALVKNNLMTKFVQGLMVPPPDFPIPTDKETTEPPQ